MVAEAEHVSVESLIQKKVETDWPEDIVDVRNLTELFRSGWKKVLISSLDMI